MYYMCVDATPDTLRTEELGHVRGMRHWTSASLNRGPSVQVRAVHVLDLVYEHAIKM